MFSARQTPATGTDALARLGWHDFEHLLAEHYRDQGWRVEYHAPPSSLKHLGSSLDLRLHRGNETVIVQCKHWDTVEVQLAEVNELLSTMLNEAATRCVLVTRGRFSAEARAVPRRQPRLQLIDADVLRVMLKLPDHRGAAAPGIALPTVAARKAAAKRRGADGKHSRLLPILLVIGIALLIGIFVWRAMAPRHEGTVPMPSDDSTTSTPLLAPPAPPVVATPAATTPANTTSAEAPLSRELAERARLHASPAAARDAHRPSEDAIKVLEKNTREVGSAE
ncbi:restriction endonuclease [Luteibacter sp. E-22]|uniref:restriction endonuclease n=1 Tax=Luteibacter sp. E-22 TaxID=3404050 RepID=UPI003CE85751